MVIIGYIFCYHAVFIASLILHFQFSISSIIGIHQLELTGLPWNFDRKTCRSHLNVPKLVVFDNQMNHLYSNSAISIFPLLILLLQRSEGGDRRHSLIDVNQQKNKKDQDVLVHGLYADDILHFSNNSELYSSFAISSRSDLTSRRAPAWQWMCIWAT